MPSASFGKMKISRLRPLKKGIEIIFNEDKNTKIVVDYEIYADYYLYLGKELDAEVLSEINEKIKQYKNLRYAINLLSGRSYTTMEIKNKLLKRKLSESDCHKIITTLQDNKLLNDQKYQEEYLEYALENHKSARAIKRHLLQKGIIAKDLIIDQKTEEENAQKLFFTLVRKVEKYPVLLKKQHLYQMMIKEGFTKELVSNLIEENILKDEQREQELLRKDFSLGKSKYQLRYQGAELRKRLISFLERKGYYYSDIKNIMEEQIDGLD